VDRFHISTQAWQRIYANKKYDFAWLERRLAKLGFRLVFCWRSPDSFEEARRRRLKISGNPSQYEDLSIFLREQEVVQEFVDHSLLPKLVVDVTDNRIDRVVKQVADWLEATGGLTAQD
jgi:thymidylate kinase